MTAALVLFDDAQVDQWAPLTLTRPAGELLFGAKRLVRRAEEALGLECIGYVTGDHLIDFDEAGARPVLREADLPGDRDLLYWCSRAAPRVEGKLASPQGPTAYLMDGRPVGFFAPSGSQPPESFLRDLSLSEEPDNRLSVGGVLLEWVWDLMLKTPEWLVEDLGEFGKGSTNELAPGVHKLGEQVLSLGDEVRIEPGVVFDLRDGAIRLDDGVEIRSGTRLAGPSRIGPYSRLLGGSFEAIVTGPYSYLRGEISHAVILGYSNKAHDGYLGHAYVGRWVNLGAFTTNSDLKNNYHSVRAWTPSGVRDTEELKVGCFLGDHVKTGIGCLLGTGTVVGAGANVYGSRMPPSYVPPFSWGEGDDLAEYRLEDFIETAGLAMKRRYVDLGEAGRRYLESCWRKGRGG